MEEGEEDIMEGIGNGGTEREREREEEAKIIGKGGKNRGEREKKG